MANISEWDVTAAGNNTGSPPDFPIEGMAPSTVNDTMRENMAAVARWYQDSAGALTSAGTGNAYTLTTNSGYTSLADQSVLAFRVDRENTGAATLSVDGLGAKSIRVGGAALGSGALPEDVIIAVAYNSTDDAYDVVSMTAIVADMVPDLPASKVTSGSFDTDRIPNLPASKTTSGSFGVDRIPSLPASKTTSGTFDDARMPSSIVRTSRSVSSGNGLSGGGNLSSNRTLSMSGSYTGTFTASGDSRAGSDIRLKDDFRAIDAPMVMLRAITGLLYYRTDLERDQYGVVAQHLQDVMPEAVGEDEKTGMLSVAYNQIIPVLLEAVKELDTRVRELESN